MIKYAVYPGFILSQSDLDRHYISASQLMRLHGVAPAECIIIRNVKDTCGLRSIERDLIKLFPRADGNYKSYAEEGGGK